MVGGIWGVVNVLRWPFKTTSQRSRCRHHTTTSNTTSPAKVTAAKIETIPIARQRSSSRRDMLLLALLRKEAAPVVVPLRLMVVRADFHLGPLIGCQQI